MNIKKFTVIGAGNMGHGIAELAAIAGFEVWLNDINHEVLKNAINRIKWSLEKLYEKGNIKESSEKILDRIHITTNLEYALEDTDFMVEAVVEDINIKKQIFSKADIVTSSHSILATNTSSLPISEISSVVKKPERVIGMHFFYPPVLMKLVEIIKGNKTSENVVRRTYEIAKILGKEPIIIARDIPGFMVNRILFRLYDIACYLVENGKASIEEIDATAIYELGLPLGIFILQDFTGLDVNYLAMKAMNERGYNSYYCLSLENKVKTNQLGVKSGKGFYTYPTPGKFIKPIIPRDKLGKINALILISPAINEAAYLLRNNIASKEEIDKGCKLGLGWPMGVLEIADQYGIDEVVKTLSTLVSRYELNYLNPDPLLIQMVNENKLGVKSGKGFYTYS
ncbi:3-hydroxyacyl-CoA dehydrogenase [Saccharolobus caldissimus]|uniref:3-hydroxyacyl-CoA dehydrogenase n=1 Tax=Saccharolobus caldissimus TaxID=1702097 RepID=A0AAQ4CRG0_9CREN|nr:3-hydroxyacyl-CoA dehydrogenase [Saccharolobus caldissimus]BDB98391.1 hypothetical protein SACC_14080 [Saccharolobus caldissimus]